MQVAKKGALKRISMRKPAASASSASSAASRGRAPPSNAQRGKPVGQVDASKMESRLTAQLLEWDFLADVFSTASVQPRDTPLPDRFKSWEEYLNTWEPLVIHELKASIVSNAQSGSNEHKGAVEVFVAEAPELHSSNLLQLDVGGYMEDASDKAKKMYSDLVAFDLLLITKERLRYPIRTTSSEAKNGASKGETSQGRKAAEPTRPHGVLALVHSASRSHNGYSVTLQVDKMKWAEFLGATHPADASAASVGTRVQLTHLAVLTTYLRELVAVCNTEKTEIAPYILDPTAIEQTFDARAAALPYLEHIRSKFNTSQNEAIEAAVSSTRGFTLIQGPPGTGKTSTVIGLLNGLHLLEYQRYYDAIMEVAVQPDGREAEKRWQEIGAQKPHILVCAPSNIAADNILERILEDGFLDGHGGVYKPVIFRVGRGQGARVKAVSIDEQVDNLLNIDPVELQMAIDAAAVEATRLSRSVLATRRKVQALAAAFSQFPLPRGYELRVTADENPRAYFVNHAEQSTSFVPPTVPPSEQNLASDYPTLQTLPEYLSFAHQLTQGLEQFERANLRLKRLQLVATTQNTVKFRQARHSLEESHLLEAHIVFTTLNSAGLSSLESCAASTPFGIVVVDEAAQAVEPSSLIPMQYGCRKCVLVGDPQQLPATIFAQSGKVTKYERSLFQRLADCGQRHFLLNTQYRMHPDISEFPRTIFYEGLLLDGDNVLTEQYNKPYHHLGVLGPFRFFNIAYGAEQTSVRSSRSNPAEARFAIKLVDTLYTSLPSDVLETISIGIISPYNEQVRMLKQLMASSGLPEAFLAKSVEISTVDGFQGREKDVIIFSCVRASPESGIGFLADVRRMNVGLTRAKYALFVLGREEALKSNRKWASLIEYARERNAIVDVPSAAFDLLAPAQVPPDSRKVARKRRQSPSPLPPPPPQPRPDLEEGEVDDSEPEPPSRRKRGRRQPRHATFDV